MSRFLIFTVVLAIILSCSDDDSSSDTATCGVDNPIEDLDWLRAEINDRETNPTEATKYCYIEQAELNGQDVFIYQDCNPLIDKIPLIFDCDGNSLGFIGTDISGNDLTNFCVIWKPDDFACLIDFSCVRNE